MSDSNIEVKNGFIDDERVIQKTGHGVDKNGNLKPFKLERGEMLDENKHAIVIHQTHTETAEEVFNNYANPKTRNGAHFLIDKDGTIYQTASLDKGANHVGEIKARCLSESNCSQEELDAGLEKWNKQPWINNGQRKSHDHEKMKDFPDRFPKNEDSIGIECVGKAWKYDKEGNLLEDQSKSVPDKRYVYESLTDKQKESLKWLSGELAKKYDIPASEIYRHPEIAVKLPSEAESAKPVIEELRREEQIRKEHDANKSTTPSNESQSGQQPQSQTPGATVPVSPGAQSNEIQASAGELRNTAEWSPKADAFRQLSPEKAVQQYPELAPAYASVRAIEAKVEADGLPEEHRNTVMSRVRENVAGQIKNGNIPGVQMQEKSLAQAGQSTDLSA